MVMFGPSPKTDEELIAEVQRGSRESFELLYARYKTRIFNYINTLMRQRQMAEDCTQDVFILLYQKAGLYKPTGKFSSWLYSIAKNRAMTLLTRKKDRAGLPLDGPLEQVLESPGIGPDAAAESREAAEMVWEAMGRIAPDDREVIYLCDIKEMPHEEVGRILGCKAGTVTVKLYRARRRLGSVMGLKSDFFDKEPQ